MATVTFDHATCSYPGSTTPAVKDLDLQVADGEFMVLVGPSGSGKSTALRMVAGLEPVTSGRILIGDRDVSRLPPNERDIAMVFQNYALYPHMTVEQNMGFALEIEGDSKREISERVRDAAQILDLDEFLQRTPKALSGGQRQRVAMGRAMVRNPHVFLMDEPLSNLDAKLRVQTRTQIAAMQRRLGVTTVYVTHDQVEAQTMGDRVAVLRDGVLQQLGTPHELYENPTNVFVAGFIGSPAMNLLDLPAGDDVVHLGDLAFPVQHGATDQPRSRVVLGVRPEHLEVAEQGLEIEVEVVERLGADAYIYGRAVGTGAADHPVRPGPEQAVDDEGNVLITARMDGHHPPAKGARLVLAPRPHTVHLFDTTTGRTLDAVRKVPA